MSYTNGLDKPSDYFNTVLYTGNGNQRNITGVGFQPDWIWGKNRSATGSHNVIDSVRGVSKIIYTNLNDAEATDTSSFNAFGSDGFSVGSQSNVNGNGNSIVAWNWKAGTSFTNDASATGIGTIDSTGSVNTDAGFSIVKWVGTASNATIAHGLGTTPSVFISKSMAGAHSWGVYHKSIGIGSTTLLNSNGASDADATYYGGTSPTSTIMGLGTANATNASGDMIGYAFAEKQGFSKFGSYIGNGNADGTFTYLGFKPAFVILKSSTSSADWELADNKRTTSGGNVIDKELRPNTSGAETGGTDGRYIDFVSNGFKLRQAFGNWNGSGETYIYMAFAENPFVTSSGVPACAK